jgi:phytoene synthase
MKEELSLHKVVLPNDLVGPLIGVGWEVGYWDSQLNDIVSDSNEDTFKNVQSLSRKIIKSFSSNFYTISRILPKDKRSAVECIYSMVRFPDEIVDSFNLSSNEKHKLLDEWEDQYVKSLDARSFKEALDISKNPLISYFREFCISLSIPVDCYPNFTKSMRSDIEPRMYKSFDDLIQNYVFGSAITVGYLLTHAYGHAESTNMVAALKTSRSLGIALQLTNFARDIKDDLNRQRCYVPLSLFRSFYNSHNNELNIPCETEVRKAQVALAEEAEKYYCETWKGINNFSADSLPAIKACLRVFQQLNKKIISNEHSVQKRISLSIFHKIRSVPYKHYPKMICLYLDDAINN